MKYFFKDLQTILYKNIILFYLLKWLSLGICIGILVGAASTGFLISLDWAGNIRDSYPQLLYFLPLGGFLVGLMYHFWGQKVEAGNNLLIETIHQPSKERISIKMSIFIYIGTILTHLFGGSAGREGTALQMSGGIVEQFSRFYKFSERDRRVLLIAAISAGFGAVFGTPLAGAIFGLEVFLIGKIRYEAIYPAFISAYLADYFTKIFGATHTHYSVHFFPEFNLQTASLTILAGIFFGICARLFSSGMTLSSNLFKKHIHFPPFRPIVGGVLLIIVVLLLDTTKYIGLGIPTIIESFEKPLPYYDFILKILLTILTLSAGFKGGEVTPLFFIGATLGNALSYIIPLPISVLSGMGFVAVFAGASNTPLACLLMGVELFGSPMAPYVAFASITSYLISGHSGIYKKQILGQAKNHSKISDEGKNLGEID